jgi:hypothetical protein
LVYIYQGLASLQQNELKSALGILQQHESISSHSDIAALIQLIPQQIQIQQKRADNLIKDEKIFEDKINQLPGHIIQGAIDGLPAIEGYFEEPLTGVWTEGKLNVKKQRELGFLLGKLLKDTVKWQSNFSQLHFEIITYRFSTVLKTYIFRKPLKK